MCRVLNCPCYDKDYEECLNTQRDEYIKCEDIENCVIKRIIKLCKDVNCDVLINTSINNKTRKNRCGAIDGMPLCCEVIAKKDILNLLEIEEINE